MRARSRGRSTRLRPLFDSRGHLAPHMSPRAASARRVGHARVWEHAFVTFADALLYLYALADTGDERFPEAAARWHARFTLEARLPLGEAEMLMQLLSGVRGANRLVIRRQLLRAVDRAGLTVRDMAA